MPSPVDRYFKEVKDQNPTYSDAQAWATAWSIYCKHKNPGSDHCQKDPSEYLTGKAAGVIVRVASRFIEKPDETTLAARVARRFMAVDYLVIGKWYEQTFADGDKIYFKALAKQKNGGWAGVQVEVDPTRPRKKPKAKRYSTPKHATGWKECKDVPADVEDAAKGYDIAERVASRFKMSHLGLLKADEVAETLERGSKILSEAQALAKKAEAELGKFEKEAKAIHHDAVDGLRKVKDAAEKVPHKDTPSIVAAVEKCIRLIQSQDWTDALSTGSGLVQFVIHGFGAMQKAYTRIRTKPEVLEVQRVLKADLQPVRVELQKLQEKFDKEYEKYVEDLEDLVKDLTIVAYRHQEGPYIPDFNHTRDMVALEVRGLLTGADRLPNRLSQVIDSLSEMGHLFERVKTYAKTVQLGE